MAHFTYAPSLDKSSLCQGDVIERSGPLEQVLKKVHPHYFQKKDYKHFLVLTQSCDLVRRDEKPCSSPYITIAAVRPVELALQRETRSLQYDEIETDLGICDERRKSKLYQFLERLLNNNEDRYFFLYREPLRGLEDDHCAFLQLSIPLKSSLHYQTVLDAKILQLTEPFQHKLGYLVGNSYSRVGTEDWLPNHATAENFRKATRKPVDDLSSVNWIEGSIHKQVLKRLKAIPSSERTLEKLEEAIREIGTARGAKRIQVLEAVENALSDLEVDGEKITRVRARLESDPNFKAAIR